ncbi:hypothetical protein XBJ2_500033 [Xenorhabdus bovienii str. Jollieti]|uniref:DUF2591 domain-containing protein n=1 Tax=Xenorhabdus bovienii (strain SS-2004) TaxID=406818 RepID=D3UXF1_XENBS|nr:phage protein NinX family protein [Xenorhabdus bovienii]CBJ80326.1 hypothetical protein XBJ1_1192 [Xenorhabdus bovienii SS-2004]CDH30058.1 hypothetical protein XBJ2_500033 [Xenorhabdus bovienii str. Jollieti]
MKLKTSELTGRALDFSVAKATDMDIYIFGRPSDAEYGWIGNNNVTMESFLTSIVTIDFCGKMRIEFNGEAKSYSPSTNWSQCGELIEKYHIELYFNSVNEVWSAYIFNYEKFESVIEDGSTPQIAICRAVVAAKLGDEIEIPDELVEGV